MSDRPPCVDFIGNEIKAGDIVVYPNRKGSQMWLVKSHVLGVEWKFDVWGCKNWALKIKHPSGAIRTVTNINRVIVITPLVESE